MIAPAFPPTHIIDVCFCHCAVTHAFLCYAGPVVLSHTRNFRHNFTTRSMLTELLIKANGTFIFPFQTLPVQVLELVELTKVIQQKSREVNQLLHSARILEVLELL